MFLILLGDVVASLEVSELHEPINSPISRNRADVRVFERLAAQPLPEQLRHRRRLQRSQLVADRRLNFDSPLDVSEYAGDLPLLVWIRFGDLQLCKPGSRKIRNRGLVSYAFIETQLREGCAQPMHHEVRDDLIGLGSQSMEMVLIGVVARRPTVDSGPTDIPTLTDQQIAVH